MRWYMARILWYIPSLRMGASIVAAGSKKLEYGFRGPFKETFWDSRAISYMLGYVGSWM